MSNEKSPDRHTGFPHRDHLAKPHAEESGIDREIERTQARTEASQKLIDETVNGLRSLDDFSKCLQALSFSAAEVKDSFDEVYQRLELRKQKARQLVVPSREPTPEGFTEEQASVFSNERSSTLSDQSRTSREQSQAVEAAAWAAMQAKLDHVSSSVENPPVGHLFERRSDFLGARKESPELSSIPQSVLDVAPHLARLQSNVIADPHIGETWKLRREYAKGRIVEALINLGQFQPLKDPISRAIWKLVILDHYVDFEKLYATLDRRFDHQGEVMANHPVRSESDWTRVFDAWMAAVLVFYPHRSGELASYRAKILDFFHSIPSGAVIAIHFDRDVRNRYARNPFRMDDQKALYVPFLAQVFRVSSFSAAGTKRASSSQSQPRKRSSTICQNWNMGFCNSDTCPSNRRHNICCECYGGHRARDSNECFAKLKQRRQQYRAAMGFVTQSQ